MAQVIKTPAGPRFVDDPPLGGFAPPPYDPADPANIAAWRQAVAQYPDYYGPLAPTMMPGLEPLAPLAPIAVSGGSVNPLTGAFTQTPVVVASSNVAGAGASASLDLRGAFSSLTSGSILGIPTLYVVGGIAAYFLFFQKKGRR